MAQIRKNVEDTLAAVRPTASQAFREVIARPPEPSPQEKFDAFMQAPQEQQMAMAQELGPDGWDAHVHEMLTIGEQLMGPSIWQNRPWFDNIKAQALPLENPVEMAYDSLIDEALAETEAWQPE